MNQDEQGIMDTKPRKPIGLPYYAGNLWDKMAGLLHKHGLLTPFDVPVFEGMCWSFHFMKEAAKLLKKEGVITVDERGLIRKNPANQIYRDNLNLMMKTAAEFGLTPISRSRVSIDQLEKEISLAEILFRMADD